ncbi:MAG: helix-loop-helix domain-containing protein [Aureispira sp.]|nr:helix-loop-helix domain-containing protein [Aureispira sp.]
MNWILETYGWHNTRWGDPLDLPVFIINAFAILGYCLPFWNSKKLSKSSILEKLKVFGLLYSISFIGFFIATIFFMLIFRARFGWDMSSLIVFLCILFSLLFIITHLIHKVSKHAWGQILTRQKLLLMLGVIACIVISQVQVLYFQGRGGSFDNRFQDAVKMGYPFFWIIIIMTLIGVITEQKLLHFEKYKRLDMNYDDILDA